MTDALGISFPNILFQLVNFLLFLWVLYRLLFKPVVAMLFSPDPYGEGEALKNLDLKLQEARIPSYPTYDRAALALKRLVDYHRFHEDA